MFNVGKVPLQVQLLTQLPLVRIGRYLRTGPVAIASRYCLDSFVYLLWYQILHKLAALKSSSDKSFPKSGGIEEPLEEAESSGRIVFGTNSKLIWLDIDLSIEVTKGLQRLSIRLSSEWYHHLCPSVKECPSTILQKWLNAISPYVYILLISGLQSETDFSPRKITHCRG